MSPPIPRQANAWWRAPFFRWSLGILGAVIAGILVFEALHIPVFSRIGMPHEFCYLRDPKLIWLHVVSDTLIGAAYVSISLTLAYLVYKASRDIPFNGVFLAFGLFIVSCGFTHFMEVWVIWEPVYWLSGYVKIVTAAASLATAVALFPLVPRIFALISAARKSEQHRLQIEQLNLDLERFNYTVAHDLRAPLRSIVGFGQILEDDFAAELSPEARQHVERMRRSAQKMDALVTGLLRYATVGRQAVQMAPVSLDECLKGVLTLLETDIRDRAAIVSVDPLPNVVGDPTLLQVVFQNLIGNALKFVAPGTTPRIEVSATREQDVAIVTVRDNGLGIPTEVRNRVFGMFERFHPDHPGTGIGLAIVHRAVQRMGGEITFKPVENGSGTWFVIELRAAP